MTGAGAIVLLGSSLILAGLTVCGLWIRPAVDITNSALSLGWTALTSLYAKGPRT